MAERYRDIDNRIKEYNTLIANTINYKNNPRNESTKEWFKQFEKDNKTIIEELNKVALIYFEEANNTFNELIEYIDKLHIWVRPNTHRQLHTLNYIENIIILRELKDLLLEDRYILGYWIYQKDESSIKRFVEFIENVKKYKENPEVESGKEWLKKFLREENRQESIEDEVREIDGNIRESLVKLHKSRRSNLHTSRELFINNL